MHDITALKKKHERELRQAERENAFLGRLPEAFRNPKQVFFQTAGAHLRDRPEFADGFAWVTYDVDTVVQAVEILKAYGTMKPVRGAGRPGIFAIEADDYMEPKYKEDSERGWLTMEDGILFRQDTGEGYRFDEFYCWPENFPIRLIIRVKNGIPHDLRSFVSYKSDSFGRKYDIKRHIKRLTDLNQTYATGSDVGLHYISVFEGIDHILRVLAAEEGYK